MGPSPPRLLVVRVSHVVLHDSRTHLHSFVVVTVLVLVDVLVVVLVDVLVDVLVLVVVDVLVDVLVLVEVEVLVDVLVEVLVVLVVGGVFLAHAQPANMRLRLHSSPLLVLAHCSPISTLNEVLPLYPNLTVRGSTKLAVLSHQVDFVKVTTYSNLLVPAFFCLRQSCTSGAEPNEKARQYFPAFSISKPANPCEYIQFARSLDEGSPLASKPSIASNVSVFLINSGPLHFSTE